MPPNENNGVAREGLGDPSGPSSFFPAYGFATEKEGDGATDAVGTG